MILVVDGAVDLPPGLENAAEVRVVAGEVCLGEERFVGNQADFWERLRGGGRFSTSPPTVDALEEAYRQADKIYAVHVSAELSETVVRAGEAALRVGPGVAVIDSRSLSVGSGLVASLVRRAMDNPNPEPPTAETARQVPERVHTFVIVQDIDTLRRSGRIGLLPSEHLSRRHPLLLAIRGRALVLDQPKDRSGALRGLVGHAKSSCGGSVAGWALGHGDAADVAQVSEHLSKAFGRPPLFEVLVDPTVGAHVGPDAVVVAVY